jgi:two-component system, response regulator PdtaR
MEKPKVLIVEDETLVRLSMVLTAEDNGYSVFEAGNADEAIAILETHPDIRLVVTDIEMPGTTDGIVLAHFIRNRWPPIHLIVASGRRLNDTPLLAITRAFLPQAVCDRSAFRSNEIDALSGSVNHSQL